ncbi:MAG: hypothetical protein LIP16_10205 [Clostridium sp.]|nr:hypothetical protein [Clostridium sp.]
MEIKKIEKILQMKTYGMYYQACHQWAKFLEHIDMAWIYCPDDSRGTELGRVADFHLPDQDAYLIVDLGRPDRGYIDCKKLSKQNGKLIVLGGDQGDFKVFEDGEDYSKVESVLCQCAVCGRYFFMNEPGSYECRVCGKYDGDHHLAQWLDGDSNLFDMMPAGDNWLFKKVRG